MAVVSHDEVIDETLMTTGDQTSDKDRVYSERLK